MSNKIYSGSIALTKLQSAIITTKKGTRAIVLPIDPNFLEEKDGAVYMQVNIVIRPEKDKYGQDGLISQKLPSAKYKELGKEKANEIELPILGNIKDFSNIGDSAGATQVAGNIDPEEDDLPF